MFKLWNGQKLRHGNSRWKPLAWAVIPLKDPFKDPWLACNKSTFLFLDPFIAFYGVMNIWRCHYFIIFRDILFYNFNINMYYKKFKNCLYLFYVLGLKNLLSAYKWVTTDFYKSFSYSFICLADVNFISTYADSNMRIKLFFMMCNMQCWGEIRQIKIKKDWIIFWILLHPFCIMYTSNWLTFL